MSKRKKQLFFKKNYMAEEKTPAIVIVLEKTNKTLSQPLYVVLVLILCLLVVGYLCFLLYANITHFGKISFKEVNERAKEAKNIHHSAIRLSHIVAALGV